MVVTTRVAGQLRFRSPDEVLLDAVSVFNRPDLSHAQRSNLTFLLVKMKTDSSYLPPLLNNVIDLDCEDYLARAVELLFMQLPGPVATSFRLLARTLNAHRLT